MTFSRGRVGAPLVSVWLLLAISVVFGGNLYGSPLAYGAVVLAGFAAIVICILFAERAVWSGLMPPTRWAIMALVALPVLHLVPLPPSIWQHLGARDAATASLELVGAAQTWRPLTLHIDGTLSWLLALVVPLGAFFGVRALTDADRGRVTVAVVSIAFVSAAIGMAQQLSQSTQFAIYAPEYLGEPLGLFANRNHQALLLVIAFALLCAPLSAGRRLSSSAAIGALAAAAVLGGCIVITASRTGVVLMLLCVAVLGLVFLGARTKGRTRLMVGVGVGVAVAVVGLVALLASGSAGSLLGGRFEDVGVDYRWVMWPSSVQLMQAYLPWGSGLGSFVPVYAAREQLDTMSQFYVNHAHNDYLELLVEAGVAGAALAIVLGVAFVQMATRALRADSSAMLGPFVAIAMVAGHSLVDYPGRTAGIAAICGALLGCLSCARGDRRRIRVRATAQEDAG